jgi:hypothetical protein
MTEHTDEFAAIRKAFEAHVLAWTGRDIAYHTAYGTTGIGFGWACWKAAADRAAERERCAQWLRDHYQDHPNIASLCDAMMRAALSERAAPVAEWQASANGGKTWRKIDPEGTGMSLAERVEYLSGILGANSKPAYLIRALYAAPQPATAAVPAQVQHD